ncbi:uncharacterized protein F4817DRAFT_263654 [Daldinia loculata]|uniref:uncharacterized protein n=1 Tax=Daldinia loculata TaxID=103429 RepID=UPI0020C527F6|nr:uncharacterized protein F4817DRAFT_263654 [Daldinia loculata]KAI1650530.1 hypothetical protein F4817DRAFT_263654 [Daldinia loculata]
MASSNDITPPESPGSVFHDFDLEHVFKKAEQHVRNEESKNFVVEFGSERARIAFDFDIDDARKLLLDQDPDEKKEYPIRWINIWDPSGQKEIMKAISDRYEFSRRLLGLMTTPRTQRDEIRRHKHRRRVTIAHLREPRDVEKGESIYGDFPVNPAMNPPAPAELNDNIALYLQVKDTVNYFSTDQTPKAFCIGANWLHKRPTPARKHPRISIMPPKHWQWLVLCNNHTVLSIHEQHSLEPVPDKEDWVKWRQAEFEYMRAHTLDILRQLSIIGYGLYENNPLAQIAVRTSLGTSKREVNRQQSGMSLFSNSEIGSLADEGTSNLFYYLFEDYVAAGPLKAAEQELEELTEKVLESTRRKKMSKSYEIIPTLHYLSKDLREFKHLFENYKNLISKVMVVGKPELHHNGGLFDGDRKVYLSNSALSRFDRLSDRLQYLMLNTIEGYLEEIGAISTTYFNLTQQKDSQATARLTRSATLLAKLSVFFLPISFMTSYFSVQVEDLYVYWTGKMYWTAFAVIASVSFVSLFFFSRLLMFAIDELDAWAAVTAEWMSRVLQTLRAWLRLKPKDGDKDD